MQVLPKAGFSRPTMVFVLPHRWTGMCTGTWMALPEMAPGEPTAAPSATESGVGYRQARTRENETAVDSRESDDLLGHISSLPAYAVPASGHI
jgi:hypothetical protein